MMQLLWQQATVTRILSVTPRIRRFFLRMPVNVFDFVPGQFITLDLPIHPKKTQRLRSYSIASPPDQGNEIELLIVHIEQGAATTYLWEQVKEGDPLTYRGPNGNFTMPAYPMQQLFLIASSTGIAPFHSMLALIEKRLTAGEEIILVYGARTQDELLYQHDWQQLAQQYAGFHFIPILTRESWAGQNGRVHAVYPELARQYPQAHVMICGWDTMVDETRQHFLELGFDKSQLHAESYG